MGKASRRKREHRSAGTPTEVSSRRSFRSQGNLTEDSPASTPCPDMSASSSTPRETSNQRSANWGGRRANQTGRPKLYDNDEERRAAAAARRRAARMAIKDPPRQPRGRPPKKEATSSWGGARSGAGRPLIYKTREERRARNSELSQQSSARRRIRRDAHPSINELPQDWKLFAIRTTTKNPSSKPT